jgi:hypothetical protein
MKGIVIPGRASSRDPGIHNHDLGLWNSGLRQAAHPGNDGKKKGPLARQAAQV